MFCVNCGKKVGDGFTFCPFCGAKVFDGNELPEEDDEKDIVVPVINQNSLKDNESNAETTDLPLEEPVPVVDNKPVEEESVKEEIVPLVLEKVEETFVEPEKVEPIQTPPVPPKFEQPKKNNNKKVIIIVICTVVVLCVAIVAVLGNKFFNSSNSSSSNNVTIKVDSFEETEIYNKNDIVITFEEIDSDDTTMYYSSALYGDEEDSHQLIKVKVENDSNKNIVLDLQSFFVNDSLIQSAMLLDGEVEKGDDLNTEIYVSDTNLKDNGIETIEKLTFNLLIYNSDSYDDIASVVKEVYAKKGQDFSVNKNEDGQTIVDEKDLKVVYLGATALDGEEEYDYAGYLTFYVENNTSKSLIYHLEDMSINDVMYTGSGLLGNFLSNTNGVIKVAFFNNDLKDFGASSFGELKDSEFVVSVMSSENYDDVYTSDMISITINKDAKTSSSKTAKSTSVDGVTLDEQEIYNKGGVSIEVTGMEEDDYGYININFTVKNDSEDSITIDGDCYINNCYIGYIMCSEIQSGKKASHYVQTSKSSLESAGIEKIAKIDFDGEIDVNYAAKDTFAKTVYTSLGKDYKLESVTDGKEIYNNGSVSILMRGYSEDEDGYTTLKYYAKNNSDTKYEVELQVKSINGVDISDKYFESWTRIASKMNALCDINLYDFEDLPVSSTSEIKELVIEINVYRCDTYDGDKTTVTLTTEDLNAYTK